MDRMLMAIISGGICQFLMIGVVSTKGKLQAGLFIAQIIALLLQVGFFISFLLKG